METINCNVCGEKESEKFVSQTDIVHRTTEEIFDVVKCRGCGFCYLNPRPTPAEMAKYYREDYSYHSRASDTKLFLTSLIINLLQGAIYASSWRRLFLRMLFLPANLSWRLKRMLVNKIYPRPDPFIDLARPCRILDVGCGTALHTNVFGSEFALTNLRRHGFSTFGVEPSADARSVASSAGHEVIADLMQNQWRPESFDIIRMNWSLEHVHDPRQYLLECQRLLRTGGRLIVAIPNSAGFIYDIYPTSVEVPVHLSFFTIDTFVKLAGQADFRVIMHYTFSRVAHLTETLMLYNKNVYRYLSFNSLLDMQRLFDEFDVVEKGADMVFLLEKRPRQ